MTQSFTRALIFELDGTAIPKKPRAKPSAKVVMALTEAQKKAHVIFATDRSFKAAKEYVKLLNITEPCVTLGGSQVVDPETGKVLWEQDLDPGVPVKILEIAKTFSAKVYDHSNDKYVSHKTYKVKSVEPMIVLLVPDKSTNEIVKQIKKIPLLNVETSPSLEKSFTKVTIKHIHATKFLALQTISKKLKLNPKECVGVGDGTSDITLLNFCGIKIAMGSATSRLKELAQHIAPTIQEDGLAWVVEKFLAT